ncbi:MAG TPA: putative toxin-antitoxin system toxin component, PIN family [Planctomycetaceae bacterium]|nr:putative toxin-antitoxin system toxin component, PIN family [Planctomycetaceae bacterium]
MQVDFDADVLIPMIVEASRSARLFSRLQVLGHEVVASPQILDEVAEKFRTKPSLRKWLDLSDEEIEEFLSKLPSLCRMVPGVVNAHGAVPADPKDDKIVAAAIEGKADYIISEDKHLRNLRQHQGIKIMSRDEFMAELDRLTGPE